jgi:CRISPR-associated protein (TIGR02584 family)
MEPSEYSRRVLLAVTGLSPQVVTETLYALAVQRRRPLCRRKST